MMKVQKIQRMQELVPLLAKAARMYEQENTEIMSNQEYDKLYDELVALEQETGIVQAGSVTQKVGYEVLSELPKVRHNQRILSLDKTKEVSKLVSFLGEQKGLLSWKLDGLTLVLTYTNGELTQAVTRGNGEVGEDITSNAKTFANLPLKFEYKDDVTIRGEAIITYSQFEKINKKLPEDEKYKNPRNLCSGSVRQLDSKITAQRNVHFYAFTIVSGGLETDSKEEQILWLKDQGFETVEYKALTSKELPQAVEWFSSNVTKRDFATDGLVLTLDSLAISQALGVTAKFPKDSIAFKWQDELKETTLISIQWNTARTGSINPVAIFEPVELEGSTVGRASVHNISILEDLQLGIGDTITVYKANMIIPQIADNMTRSNQIDIPAVCPVCDGETQIKMIKDAKVLYCTNSNCEAKRLKAFVHFVGRDGMNIQGFSEASIGKFMDNGFIHEFPDLYHLSDHEEAIKELDGFGQKSYDNIIKSIRQSQKVQLPNFIYALGIEQVGLNNAKLICNYFSHDIEALMAANEEELMSVEGIGGIIAHSIYSYFQLEANKELISKLRREIEFIVPQVQDVVGSPIVDKTFVVTGQVHQFKNRKELGEKIEELGGKVVGSVSSKTNYLINNDVHSTSSKNKKAKELGIPIISEDDFLAMIKI